MTHKSILVPWKDKALYSMFHLSKNRSFFAFLLTFPMHKSLECTFDYEEWESYPSNKFKVLAVYFETSKKLFDLGKLPNREGIELKFLFHY